MKPFTSFHRLLDRLLPHHCPICDGEVADYGLCSACWSGLSFVTPPFCRTCGRPLVGAQLHDLCGPCIAKPSLLRYQRAIVRYDEASKSLILPFKHAALLDLTKLLALLMKPSFEALITDDHIVMPVPLHFTRRFMRGYNQSAELARTLCHMTNRNTQFDNVSLYRRKRTIPLARHNAKKRKAILRGAFAMRHAPVAHLQNRPVLLIDDVMTTGQTCEAAARSVLSSGARAVDVLTFARIL